MCGKEPWGSKTRGVKGFIWKRIQMEYIYARSDWLRFVYVELQNVDYKKLHFHNSKLKSLD